MEIQLDAPADAERSSTPESSAHGLIMASLKNNERLVYDALIRSGVPQKAYDLLDELQDKGLRAPMTIYRALETLIAKGYVKKIQAINAFFAMLPSEAAKPQAFLICQECNRVEVVTLTEEQIKNLFSPLNVSASDVRIEAFSDCIDACNA